MRAMCVLPDFLLCVVEHKQLYLPQNIVQVKSQSWEQSTVQWLAPSKEYNSLQFAVKALIVILLAKDFSLSQKL